ncbi:BnaA09g57250D [Brassica napus]|uniref:Branched-chain-amino-acid aminotransferase n=1 Tax=Brassica napus TaxID=3708 RepID=A0A078IXT6_BRANA|nr:BnaA09g57250D [Brassica napus]
MPIGLLLQLIISLLSSPLRHSKATTLMAHSNIVHNGDFSDGLEPWHPNACQAFVVSSDSSSSDSGYAVVTNRKETWQGLEQDITPQVSPGVTYNVSACVGVSGPFHESSQVLATVRLEHDDSPTEYIFVGKTYASRDKWVDLEGTFSISNMPDRVVIYLEGPPPGKDLLIRSVTVKESTSCDFQETEENKAAFSVYPPPLNIITNHDFSDGLCSWNSNSCDSFVVGSNECNSESYAVVNNRSETWQGLEQDITDRVSPGCSYKVSASVSVWGPVQRSAQVLATLKLEHQGSPTEFKLIGKTYVSNDVWKTLEGTFALSGRPDRVVFFLEGPPPGVDLLIKSVTIHCESDNQFERSRDFSSAPEADHHHIFLNSSFSDGLNHWSGRGCNLMLHESLADGRILPHSGTCFASATERTHKWSGIEQDITERVQRKLIYEASSVVRLSHSHHTVQATLYVQYLDQREEYIGISSVEANHDDWVKLKGKFLLNGSPARAVVYIEGPPPGIDVFVDHFEVKPAEKPPPSRRPYIESHVFGMNIVSNSHLTDGTIEGWFPLGDCHLRVGEGSPQILPPLAKHSLRTTHDYLSGRYVLATNRSGTWMGPAQMITDKVKLFLTYQVSAWVKVGSGGLTCPQDVNIALSVDGKWVNGGKVEVKDGDWHEVVGSFRIEKQAREVMLHVQGPSPGVDLMVAGLQIFAVDHKARLSYLKGQADMVRKRNVRLKVTGLDPNELSGATVKIRQTNNSFPLGSCISRSNIDNEDFVEFFLNNFKWAVFGNELKWSWTEPEQGNLNYRDADEMLRFCETYNVQTRGHCIFWEVESAIQPWVQQLSEPTLEAAVENRLTDLLTRYNGKFRHYDVNNEMLHGSFYRDKLGFDARAKMFRTAHELDPLARLFLNEYHIEDGFDSRSSPEKYIKLVHKLQKKGAPVGGIGIQGHITSPVGHIVRNALDKLSTLGLPIWFTELDVSSVNEHVRGDDLEVMLWEAFAHPAVEGVMLWGFWELFMSREDAHLVDADGEVNEAGRRFLEIKREWLTFVEGVVEDGEGGFEFRGYHGSYVVEVVTCEGSSSTTKNKGSVKMIKTISSLRKSLLALPIHVHIRKLQTFSKYNAQAASALEERKKLFYQDDEYADMDWDNLGFALTPADYMYVMKCSKDGEFTKGELSRFGNIQLSPSAGAIYEGTKAYRKENGKVLLFRPDHNAVRMQHGAERMLMPSPSVDQFVDAVKQTALANKRWVPPSGKASLYIRPLLMGTGPVLGLGPAPEYTFIVYASPVGNYFKEGVAALDLYVEEEYARAAPGGSGGVKSITNYAPVLKALSRAKSLGFSDVLYLDSVKKKYLEEASACNVFVVKGRTISTPATNGTILEGITRKSVMEIAGDQGYQVVEKAVHVDEVMDADEVFCTGTAVGVAPVGTITYQDKRVEYETGDESVCQKLRSVLVGIQTGLVEDTKGWVTCIN